MCAGLLGEAVIEINTGKVVKNVFWHFTGASPRKVRSQSFKRGCVGVWVSEGSQEDKMDS